MIQDKKMKLLVDVKDEKSEFLLELLGNFKFVKTEQLTAEDNTILRNLKDAVEEVNEIRAGNKKGVPLKEFLNEV
jgi:hypothetical protein